MLFVSVRCALLVTGNSTISDYLSAGNTLRSAVLDAVSPTRLLDRRGTINVHMAAKRDCDPDALARRLWFPGPAGPYSPEQRRAIRRLFARHVEKVCGASTRPCDRRRPLR